MRDTHIRRTVAVALVAVALAAPAGAHERQHVGRYSTPEMADMIVYVPRAVVTAPAELAPVAPVLVVPPVAPVAEPVVVVPAPVEAATVAAEPEVGTPLPQCAKPEEPNCGDPNGAGGWDEG